MSNETKNSDPRYTVADAIAAFSTFETESDAIGAVANHLLQFIPKVETAVPSNVTLDGQNSTKTGDKPPIVEIYPEYRAMGQAIRIFLLYQELESSPQPKAALGFNIVGQATTILSDYQQLGVPERYLADFVVAANDHIGKIWTNIAEKIEDRTFQGCFWGTLALIASLPKTVSPAMILQRVTHNLEVSR